jgi:hypothetical protein
VSHGVGFFCLTLELSFGVARAAEWRRWGVVPTGQLPVDRISCSWNRTSVPR